MDVYDQASAREEADRAIALAEQTRRANAGRAEVSAMHCGMCGERIPVARQRALPGVQTCVDCQTDIERGMN
ncbi:MAG: TraR/DksA C4-type zinc finger protein [Methylobacillus sp.]|jgi:phage/conjugal plasmid C-4 type zinc finger TraR family protein|nr:TraR/DksA C4-type zinc finger protein [Methylobacillus sp.]